MEQLLKKLLLKVQNRNKLSNELLTKANEETKRANECTVAQYSGKILQSKMNKNNLYEIK